MFTSLNLTREIGFNGSWATNAAAVVPEDVVVLVALAAIATFVFICFISLFNGNGLTRRRPTVVLETHEDNSRFRGGLNSHVRHSHVHVPYSDPIIVMPPVSVPTVQFTQLPASRSGSHPIGSPSHMPRPTHHRGNAPVGHRSSTIDSFRPLPAGRNDPRDRNGHHDSGTGARTNRIDMRNEGQQRRRPFN